MNSRMKNKIWDVIVIGGGPAGMIAAGKAAQRAKSVLLIEKNRILGKKLLVTGGGRCNLTNYKPDVKDLIMSYKNKPKALYSVFNQFSVLDTLDFFNSKGIQTKVEAEGRVFPVTNKAKSILDTLIDYMKNGNVLIKTNTTITNLSKKNNLFSITTNDTTYSSNTCILATGGLSAPITGSTGDGYKWLSKLGHKIVDNSLALVPIALKEDWPKQLSGLVLKDIEISIWQNNKKKLRKNGKFLFTHFGASGPTILNMSSTIGELLKSGKVVIKLDLHPSLNFAELKDQFNTHLQKENNKSIKISLKNFVTPALIPHLLQLINLDGNTPTHSVTKEKRLKLIHLLKEISFEVKNLLGADKAIISAGGVKKQDINFYTMESKIVSELYIVGDLLNIDKPSGGYSLQLCWSTGWIAGKNC